MRTSVVWPCFPLLSSLLGWLCTQWPLRATCGQYTLSLLVLLRNLLTNDCNSVINSKPAELLRYQTKEWMSQKWWKPVKLPGSREAQEAVLIEPKEKGWLNAYFRLADLIGILYLDLFGKVERGRRDEKWTCLVLENSSMKQHGVPWLPMLSQCQ